MVHMTKSHEYNKGILLTIVYTQNIESEIQINGNMFLSNVKAAILPLPALLALKWQFWLIQQSVIL